MTEGWYEYRSDEVGKWSGGEFGTENSELSNRRTGRSTAKLPEKMRWTGSPSYR